MPMQPPKYEVKWRRVMFEPLPFAVDSSSHSAVAGSSRNSSQDTNQKVLLK
jgi:hypothetical protein